MNGHSAMFCRRDKILQMRLEIAVNKNKTPVRNPEHNPKNVSFNSVPLSWLTPRRLDVKEVAETPPLNPNPLDFLSLCSKLHGKGGGPWINRMHAWSVCF
jgi:hypothetical protein